MKKMILSVLCIAMLSAVTGCGKNVEPVAEPVPQIKTYKEQLVTETAEPTPEDTKKLVPDIEKNIHNDYALNLITINGVEVDMDNLTYEGFKGVTGLHKNPIGSTLIDTETVYFNSGMYCLDNEMGTQLSVEFVDKNGELIENFDIDKVKPNEAYVKGIHFSNFWLHEDYNVYFLEGAIYMGMPKDYFTAIMGEGTRVGNNRVYKNDKYTIIAKMSAGDVASAPVIDSPVVDEDVSDEALVPEVEAPTEEANDNDFGMILDEITLLKN